MTNGPSCWLNSPPMSGKAIRRVHGQAAVLDAAERGKDELASVLYTLTATRSGSSSGDGPDASVPMPQARGRSAGALRSFCPGLSYAVGWRPLPLCTPSPGRLPSGVAIDIRLADIFGKRGARRIGAEERQATSALRLSHDQPTMGGFMSRSYEIEERPAPALAVAGFC